MQHYHARPEPQRVPARFALTKTGVVVCALLLCGAGWGARDVWDGKSARTTLSTEEALRIMEQVEDQPPERVRSAAFRSLQLSARIIRDIKALQKLRGDQHKTTRAHAENHLEHIRKLLAQK